MYCYPMQSVSNKYCISIIITAKKITNSNPKIIIHDNSHIHMNTGIYTKQSHLSKSIKAEY